MFMSKTCIGARFPAKAGRHLVFTLFFSRKAFVESAVFINFGRHYASVFMSVVSFGFPRGRDGFPVVFEWGIPGVTSVFKSVLMSGLFLDSSRGREG